MELGHAVVVRIRFGRYVQPAGAHSANHVEFVDHVKPACALDMNDMEWRSRGDCVRKYLLEPGEVSLFGRSTSTDMHVDGGAVACSNLKHFVDFPICGGGCVGRAKANRQRAAMQSLLDPCLDLI